MFERIFHRLLSQRHYWRHIDFSELAELYASRMLRVMAHGMMGIFIAIYLYQNGYSLFFIALYYVAQFIFRAAMTIPLAYLVAKIGPKHAALVSNVIYVPALLFLAALPELGTPVLIVTAILQVISVGLNNLSFLINFSKVKHDDHAGKELSYMHIIERMAAALSPVLGGVIAMFFGPQVTLIVASLLFMVAAGPLFFSPEPVRTNQHISFKFFNWRKVRPGLLANSALGADFVASGQLWSLYIAITVFGIASQAVYATVGAVMSITLLVAIASAHIYGRIIDHRRGGDLLRFAVGGNFLLHLTRPFVQTPVGVLMMNVANEAFTTGQNMPFTRGMFDMADSLPGYRIAYIAVMEAAACLGAAMFYLILAVCVTFAGDADGMRWSYVILAPIILLIPLHGFAALKRIR